MVCQLLQVSQEDPGINLAHDTEQRDSSVVVAVTSFTFVLIQGDDFGVSHVLWYGIFFPELAE